jgi:twinkle protein
LPEVYHEYATRGLTAGTVRKFGVTVVQDEASKVESVNPRYDKDGKHVGNKIRYRDKGFSFEGDPKRMVAFGRQLFPAGGKFITVCEGHEDAMAAYQMFGSRYPVVAVDSTSEAYNQLKDDWEYYNSFETIVINFDNDAEKIHPDGTKSRPGQEAALKCASLFPLGKVRLLTLADAKDANDYLLKGWADKYTKEWWNAPVWTPSGLKLGRDMWDEIKEEVKYETVPYPWASANEMTYGMRLSEVVLLTADTGIGKTQIAKEIEHNILKEAAEKGYGIGLIHLEETNRDTALGLMSIAANKPLHLPDVRADVTVDELRGYYDNTVNTDRVVIWDHFGSNTVAEVLAKIRHMHALGCKYIFLDHLSIVVSDQSGDERKQLDEISTKLKTVCMELNIAVFAIIHINRAGLVRGSAGPEQIANIVFYASRDKTDPDPWRRNVTKIVCTKNRFCGRTGPMTYLIYDMFTGRLREMDREEIAKFEAGGGMPLEEQW